MTDSPALEKLLSNQDTKELHIHLLQTWLDKAEGELNDALDLAARRSGTRGKAAREDVKRKEIDVARFKKR